MNLEIKKDIFIIIICMYCSKILTKGLFSLYCCLEGINFIILTPSAGWPREQGSNINSGGEQNNSTVD